MNTTVPIQGQYKKLHPCKNAKRAIRNGHLHISFKGRSAPQNKMLHFSNAQLPLLLLHQGQAIEDEVSHHTNQARERGICPHHCIRAVLVMASSTQHATATALSRGCTKSPLAGLMKLSGEAVPESREAHVGRPLLTHTFCKLVRSQCSSMP